MNVKLTYRGRSVTYEDVAFINQLIAAHPTATRRALSIKLCEAWNWVQPNGSPCDMVCRGLMLALHRAGHIELPPPRYVFTQAPSKRHTPAPVATDTAPLCSSLKAIRPADVLAHRAETLTPPIQMCDALTRNLPKELETIVANCLAHGRRQFVEVVDRFPDECRHVLEVLKEVYKNDALARERNLSPAQRLQFHRGESGPLMKEFRKWLNRQFDDRRVEPNSALGEAISYLLNHWEKLTLFLREPGAPLDNNICERILKRAILHRKNALFYKTLNGAHVGDLFMSLIHTCQLNDVNPFDYLTELQRHAEELAEKPENWMPWNYRGVSRTYNVSMGQ